MNKNISPEEFVKKLSETKKTVNDEIDKAIRNSCILVQRTIVKGMTNTPIDTRKVYYTNNKTKGHSPSLEGNYPAVDTGKLRQSITYDVSEENGKVTGRVGSALLSPLYPVYLEFGTSRNLKARPFIRPALLQNEKEIKRLMLEALKKGIEK